MSGLTWPSAARGSVPSNTTVSATSSLDSAPPATTVSMASSVTALTAPDSRVSFSSSVSDMTTTASGTGSSSANSTAATGSKRTTHVQITKTVTVTPAAVTGSKHTTHVQITKTVTVTPTAAVEYTHSPAPHETNTHTRRLDRESAISEDTTSSGSTNQGPIIGAIIGVIVAVLIMIVLVKCCKRSKRSRTKSRDVERGQPTPRRRYPYATELTDLGRTRHRNAPHRHPREPPASNPYGANPTDLALAYGWQTGPGTGLGIQVPRRHTTRRNRGPVSATSSFGMSPSRLAEANAWSTPFAADNFQSTRTYGGNSAPLQIPTRMPTRKPVPQARPLGRLPPVSYHTRYDRNAPVSPLTADDARYDHGGPRNYDDVSPLNSPIMPPVLRGRF
ncbi:hypothetical protein BDW02DRAFT_596904 [Decorospora gaudefroyi]|uniref:Mid2 domain-containing protein n=1 Tax=Decorospora gaudefroyi TaxID=184978 RepID=A0A6A5KFT8_9PLEO|nr:hypothetical protein BDW02DRAFT_596904 [Decorospora gaudefroyi]